MRSLEAQPPAIFYNDLVTLCQLYQGSADMRIIYGQKPDPQTPNLENLDMDRLNMAHPSTANLDEYHAQRLGALPHCRLYPYAESEHAVVKYLIDTHQIDGLLQSAIWDDLSPADAQSG